MSSDFDVLINMGFEKERVELAVKQTGGLQGALQWLEDNQDKSLEEIKENTKTGSAEIDDDPTALPPDLKEGEVARSLICNDCGKQFRSQAQAEFHAEKSGHQNFAESTEEIAPLSKEEAKEKLEELKRKAAEKKAQQALIDKEEAKKNEKIRMKSTKEVQQIKEDLAKKELIKEAAAKKQEKLNDIAAKKRIQEKIAADKEERRAKAERIKAEREGRALVGPEAEAATPVVSKPASTYTEARLRLQTSGGNVQKTFSVDATLFEVAQVLEAESGYQVESFTLTFPKKVFSGSLDFAKTLKEAGLVPSAVLIVK